MADCKETGYGFFADQGVKGLEGEGGSRQPQR
jgi:hypothetical protein